MVTIGNRTTLHYIIIVTQFVDLCLEIYKVVCLSQAAYIVLNIPQEGN